MLQLIVFDKCPRAVTVHTAGSESHQIKTNPENGAFQELPHRSYSVTSLEMELWRHSEPVPPSPVTASLLVFRVTIVGSLLVSKATMELARG